MIPPSCVDNFYKNPDSVRDFALSLDFVPPPHNQNYPGFRTKCLSKIDNDFFEFSVKKFISSFFDLKSIPVYVAESYFQKIYTFNSDRHHLMNEGWAHKDEKFPFNTHASVVYLNKNTCLDSGTKILRLKKEHENHKLTEEDLLVKRSLYHKHLYDNKDVDENLYSKIIQKHNSKFDTTVEFKNVYNRIVAYDGSYWHKQSSFWVPEEFRLTQVFFVEFNKKNSFNIPFNNKKLQYS